MFRNDWKLNALLRWCGSSRLRGCYFAPVCPTRGARQRLARCHALRSLLRRCIQVARAAGRTSIRPLRRKRRTTEVLVVREKSGLSTVKNKRGTARCDGVSAFAAGHRLYAASITQHRHVHVFEFQTILQGHRKAACQPGEQSEVKIYQKQSGISVRHATAVVAQ